MKTILERFVEIWKPDFLKKLSQENSPKKTFKFWFFYNSIASLVLAILALSGFAGFLSDARSYLSENYANAKIEIMNGKLSTEGINEPILKKNDDRGVFVMDTKNVQYDATILDKYDSGTFVSSDKIYTKKSSVETRSYDISKINKNFSVSQSDLQNFIKNNAIKIYAAVMIFMLIILFVFFAFFKLVSALWWALIFWVLALIFTVKEMDFLKTYYAVLNFYVIVLIFDLAMMLAGVSIPFSTFLIFLILFGVNFWKMKAEKNSEPIVIENQESKMEADEVLSEINKKE